MSWEWGRTQPGDSSFSRALTEVPDGLTWRGQGLHLADGWRLGSAGTVHLRAHEGPPQRGFRVVSLLNVQFRVPRASVPRDRAEAVCSFMTRSHRSHSITSILYLSNWSPVYPHLREGDRDQPLWEECQRTCSCVLKAALWTHSLAVP